MPEPAGRYAKAGQSLCQSRPVSMPEPAGLYARAGRSLCQSWPVAAIYFQSDLLLAHLLSACSVYISEVGGSETAFRHPPRNREIVSFRACERRTVLDVGVESQFKNDATGSRLSLFPFWTGSLSLFPWIISFPFSLN